MKEQEEKLGKALLKVALGFQVAEVTEEFAEVNGELKLTKRRKTKKDIPPDLKAVQMLLAEQNIESASMTDEELQEERERLIAQLKIDEGIGQVSVEKAKTAKKSRAKPRKRVAKTK